MSSSNVVGPGDVDGEIDDVFYVDIVHPVGVDGDVNNQLSALTKRDVVVEECLLRNQMLVWSRQVVVGIPSVIVQDCVCQVAMTSHSYGQGFQPKLNWSIMRRIPISMSCMQVCTAVAPLR